MSYSNDIIYLNENKMAKANTYWTYSGPGINKTTIDDQDLNQNFLFRKHTIVKDLFKLRDILCKREINMNIHQYGKKSEREKKRNGQLVS